MEEALVVKFGETDGGEGCFRVTEAATGGNEINEEMEIGRI
jgi:hypothetical protein